MEESSVAVASEFVSFLNASPTHFHAVRKEKAQTKQIKKTLPPSLSEEDEEEEEEEEGNEGIEEEEREGGR